MQEENAESSAFADVDTRALAALIPAAPGWVDDARARGSVVYDECLPAGSDQFRRDRHVLFRFGKDHVSVRLIGTRIGVVSIGSTEPAAVIIESRTQDTYRLAMVAGGFAGPRPRDSEFRVLVDTSGGDRWSSVWVPT